MIVFDELVDTVAHRIQDKAVYEGYYTTRFSPIQDMLSEVRFGIVNVSLQIKREVNEIPNS